MTQNLVIFENSTLNPRLTKDGRSSPSVANGRTMHVPHTCIVGLQIYDYVLYIDIYVVEI